MHKAVAARDLHLDASLPLVHVMLQETPKRMCCRRQRCEICFRGRILGLSPARSLAWYSRTPFWH